MAGTASWPRLLQLCLASPWLIDGVLQVQAFMFSRGFGQMVRAAAQGDPAVVAGPVLRAGRLIAQHPALATAAIAIVQILIGLGIAWRPTVRLALAVSVPWVLGVWWLGEGLGGLGTGTANPVTGAPGAVILYAVLAVVLWPADRGSSADVAIGRRTAGLLWLVLWGGLAGLCLRLGIRAPHALPQSIVAAGSGQPRWLASADAAVGGVLAGHGSLASFTLAAVMAVIAAGVFLPAALRRPALSLAAIMAAAMWSIGQGFGGLFTGMATDLNSGPLLVLLTAAYWPVSARRPAAGHFPAALRPIARALSPAPGPVSWSSRLAAHDADAMTVTMGLAMAAIGVPWLNPIPDGAWVVIFAAAAAWFCGRVIWDRRRESARPAPGIHLAHLLSCGGMLVMLLAPSPGPGAMSAAGVISADVATWPVLAALLVLAMAGSVVLAVDRLAGPVPAGPARCPRMRGSCQVAMALAMACMLVRML